MQKKVTPELSRAGIGWIGAGEKAGDVAGWMGLFFFLLLNNFLFLFFFLKKSENWNPL